MPSCPTCKHALEARETLVGMTPFCARCEHAWIPAALLEEFDETAQRTYTPADLENLRTECDERKRASIERKVAYYDCPGCSNKLLRRTYGNCSFLLVHYCAKHGYWIHVDSLAGIVDYIERGGEILEMKYDVHLLEDQKRQLQRENASIQMRTGHSGSGD